MAGRGWKIVIGGFNISITGLTFSLLSDDSIVLGIEAGPWYGFKEKKSNKSESKKILCFVQKFFKFWFQFSVKTFRVLQNFAIKTNLSML